MSEKNEAGRTPNRSYEATLRVGYKGAITLRRVSIKPSRKRREYVKRLERIIAICEEALVNPEALEEIQLKAADVIIRAIRMSYTIVREVDIENLERLATEIKRELEARHQPGGS